MEPNATNQQLFDRAFASVQSARERFEARDRKATEAAARILEAARTLAQSDPESYFGFKPSARDRFVVDTLERGAAVYAKLETLSAPVDSLVGAERDITGSAPARKPRLRGQRKAARGGSASRGFEGGLFGIGLPEIKDLINIFTGIADALRSPPAGSDEAPAGDGDTPTGGTRPRETPGPTGSSQDFVIEEKRYFLDQFQRALEGLERTGTNLPGSQQGASS